MLTDQEWDYIRRGICKSVLHTLMEKFTVVMCTQGDVEFQPEVWRHKATGAVFVRIMGGVAGPTLAFKLHRQKTIKEVGRCVGNAFVDQLRGSGLKLGSPVCFLP